MEVIHNRIKELRENHQLRQRQVAEHLGISQQAYSYYELDKRELPSRHVVNLAKLYKVSSDYILGIEEDTSATFNLNAKFVQDVTFKDVVITLGKLNRNNRQDVIKYLSYLGNLQKDKHK